MNAIAADVQVKLDRAINQLLAAGWNTGAVKDALGKQQSFGKYDGCTPDAIHQRANEICHEINRKNAAAFREATKQAREDIREAFRLCF